MCSGYKSLQSLLDRGVPIAICITGPGAGNGREDTDRFRTYSVQNIDISVVDAQRLIEPEFNGSPVVDIYQAVRAVLSANVWEEVTRAT